MTIRQSLKRKPIETKELWWESERLEPFSAASYLRPWELLICSFMLIAWRRRPSMLLKYTVLLAMLFTALQINRSTRITLVSGRLEWLQKVCMDALLTCMHTPHCIWLLDSAPPSFAYQSVWANGRSLTSSNGSMNTGNCILHVFNVNYGHKPNMNNWLNIVLIIHQGKTNQACQM